MQTIKGDFVLVGDSSFMFFNATKFNTNNNSRFSLRNWDTTRVTSMRGMFYGAENFNSNSNVSFSISNWNVSNVKDFASIFHNAKSFTADLSNWNIKNVKYSFDIPISYY